MTPPPFDGRVALVTGAASGMGRATALAYAAAGARVVVADVDDAGAESAVADIASSGGEALFVHTDVSRADAVEGLVRTCVERFGRLDCAVNNAAVEIGQAHLADSDEADFDRLVAVNLKGVYLCLKYEIRQLLAQGDGGAIVNIASVNAVRPRPQQSAYNATKAGVVALTRSAALEYAMHGIRVNAVSPGAIDTPMLRDTLTRFGRNPEETAGRVSPFGRFGQATEVAEAVLWLSSPLSSYTTGHTLLVDGGSLLS